MSNNQQPPEGQPIPADEARRNIPGGYDEWCQAHQIYYKDECPECAKIALEDCKRIDAEDAAKQSHLPEDLQKFRDWVNGEKGYLKSIPLSEYGEGRLLQAQKTQWVFNAWIESWRISKETKAAPVLPRSLVAELEKWLDEEIKFSLSHWIGRSKSHSHPRKVRATVLETVKGKLLSLAKAETATGLPPSPVGEAGGIWVKASERLPKHGRLLHCKTTLNRKIVTSYVKGEWDDIDLQEDKEETVLEWLEEKEGRHEKS